MRRFLGGLALLALVAAAPLVFSRGNVTVLTGTPHCCLFHVDIAWTGPQRAWGLAGRHSLPRDGGMFLEWPAPTAVALSAARDAIPIDILFIGADGRVSGIAADVPAGSATPVRSPAPVRAVLEIAGGTAAILHIRPGNRVMAPIFGDVPKSPAMVIGRTPLR